MAVVVSRTSVVLPPCDEGREVFYESAQSVLGDIGVFHGVAGVARATPGPAERSSAGNGIDVSR